MSEQEEDIHLRDLWRILSKRRGIALTIFFVFIVVAGVYAYTATPIYKGTSQLLFELERNQTLNFAGGGATLIQTKDPTEYFNTQAEIINSRSFADRVVRKLQLDRNPYFLELKERGKKSLKAVAIKRIMSIFPQKATPPPATLLPDAQFKQELDPELIDIILASLKVETGQLDTIMKINYLSEDPGVAASMANGIAATFIENNLDIRVKPYRDAAEWLSARLAESREHVSSTEKNLQQYREGKGIVSFDATGNVITQQLQELITQLVQTEAKRQDAEIRYKQIESVINTPERLATVPDVMNNLVIQGLRNEELSVKRQLSELSEKYGPKHPQVIKNKTQLDTVQKNIITEARKMLSAAKTEFEIAKSREISLRRTIEAQKQEVMDLTRKAINYNVIAGESSSNKQFYDLLLKKFQEASLSSGINISNVQIVDNAVPPKTPVKPKRAAILLIALILGIGGGIGAAAFTEYMDDTIKTGEDVDKKLKLPFFDVVPFTKDEKNPIYMTSDPKSATAEAFRTIRTGLMLSSALKQLKVILLTSATPNEGKTTTAANLAVAMAQMGERVLLIDGDMRRHDLHNKFGIKSDTGISDLIIAPEKLSEAIVKQSEYPGLDIIAGGRQAPNPSELLGSDRMKELITRLREEYDRIIIDSPPLLAFSDPLVLSTLADGVILVVWGGKTSVDLLKKAIALFKGIDAKILGVVLNKIDTTRRSYYYYPYYSHYYSDKKGKKRKHKYA